MKKWQKHLKENQSTECGMIGNYQSVSLRDAEYACSLAESENEDLSKNLTRALAYLKTLNEKECDDLSLKSDIEYFIAENEYLNEEYECYK